MSDTDSNMGNTEPLDLNNPNPPAPPLVLTPAPTDEPKPRTTRKRGEAGEATAGAAGADAVATVDIEEAAKLAKAIALTQPIIQGRHSLVEVAAARHSISPEDATPFEAVLLPGYFANIAVKLRPTDIIEVRPENNSYFAELYVWSVGKASAMVSLVTKIDRPEGMSTKIMEGYDVEFVPGPKKYRIIRVKDRTEIRAGFESENAASDWLIANRRQFAA